MRAGVTLFFQNYTDWDRFETREAGGAAPDRPEIPDTEVFQQHLRQGELVEELGFDVLWTIEHHASPYTMVTNPVQLLSYFAGRTSRIGLGTMVVVMPWHNPLRAAEDVVMLAELAGDRELRIGFGRGAGRREFKALQLDMNESRQRFREGVEIFKLAITEPRFSYEGEIYRIDDAELRPKPADPERLMRSLYASWGSPGSVPAIAELGLRPLIIPQSGWDEYHEQIGEFSRIRQETGHQPAAPVICLAAYCAETEEEARRGAEQYMTEYADSARRNYELHSDHFKEIRGYEHYAQAARYVEQNRDALGQVYVEHHVWGTPEQCIERIQRIADSFNPQELIFMMRYGSMPEVVSNKSLRLFASEVLPAIHAIEVREPTAAGAA